MYSTMSTTKTRTVFLFCAIFLVLLLVFFIYIFSFLQVCKGRPVLVVVPVFMEVVLKRGVEGKEEVLKRGVEGKEENKKRGNGFRGRSLKKTLKTR